MNNGSGATRVAGGSSIETILLVVFIVLKLTGVIEWSWLWVLSPLWIPIALVVAVVVGALIYQLIKSSLERS
ncbi:MAG: hypothetical protein LC687_00780 [Actinobacteria bacterium]|nr:hypothetical protein [Actinomycetota bacterium]